MATPFSLQIYPNPARQNLTISTQSDAKIHSLIIYNLYGKQVFHKKLDKDTQQVDLDINLPTGTYLVRGRNESGQEDTQKVFVIN